MMKAIGPSFFSEIQLAGLSGLPFSWSSDGTILYAEDMTEAQRAAVQAVYDAHDPNAPAPQPVPQAVTKYQAVVVLARHELLESANEFFGAMDAADDRRLAWEMSPTVRRDSNSTLAAAAHLGLTVAEVDALFIEAGQVD